LSIITDGFGLQNINTRNARAGGHVTGADPTAGDHGSQVVVEGRWRAHQESNFTLNEKMSGNDIYMFFKL